MESYIKQLVMIGFSSALVACASSQKPAAGAGSDCISPDSIRDYLVLDTTAVLVRDSHMDYHVMTLSKPSTLLFSGRAGFRGPGDRICTDRGDVVVWGRDERQSIRVQEVYAVDEAELESLFSLYGVRGSPQDKETDARTRKPVGASVEELD